MNYFQDFLYAHLDGIQNKNKIFSLEYGYNDGSSNIIIETFNDGWRELTYKKIQELEANNSDYIGCPYIFCNSVEKNAFIITYNDIHIEYVLNKEQQKLLKTYSKYETGFSYYNIYKKNEFAHIVVFKNPDYNESDCDKCLFFVFRTKLKTRSKL